MNKPKFKTWIIITTVSFVMTFIFGIAYSVYIFNSTFEHVTDLTEGFVFNSDGEFVDENGNVINMEDFANDFLNDDFFGDSDYNIDFGDDGFKIEFDSDGFTAEF